MAVEKVFYECPKCGRHLRGSPDKEGTIAICPGCGQTIRLVLALEEDECPIPRRPRDGEAWSGCVVAIMIVLSLGIPLLGIILGAIDMGSPSLRKRQQGMAFVAVGLVSMLVYAIALAY